ncbi:MAG: hypothetical protein GDYSWBUE_002201, partial [Candidatus Fervidibacterota bacterium]
KVKWARWWSLCWRFVVRLPSTIGCLKMLKGSTATCDENSGDKFGKLSHPLPIPFSRCQNRMGRLQPSICIIARNSVSANRLSIPLWCDCNQIGRTALILASAFNPTMVRLQLSLLYPLRFCAQHQPDILAQYFALLIIGE